MSIISPNIRPACGVTPGTIPPISIGGCYQQYKTEFANIKKKVNITQMKGLTAPYDWVAPYATVEWPQGQPGCSDYSTVWFPPYECGDGINGNIYCYDDTDDSYYQPAGAGTSSFATVAISNISGTINFHNNYITTTESLSDNKCRKLGFKSVYATKNWSGRYGYTDDIWGKPDCWDWCGQCAMHYEDVNPPTTKYLSMTANSETEYNSTIWHTEVSDCGVQVCCPDGCDPEVDCLCFGPTCGGDYGCCCVTYVKDDECTRGGIASSTCNVDQYGNITGTCSSGSTGTPDCYGYCADSCVGDPDPPLCTSLCQGAANEYYAQEALNGEDYAGAFFHGIAAANGNWNDLISMFFAHAPLTSPPRSAVGSCGNFTLKWSSSYWQQAGTVCDPGTYIEYTQTEIVITDNSCDVYIYYPQTSLNYCASNIRTYTPTITGHYHMDYSATSMNYSSWTTDNSGAFFGDYITKEVHASLSNPYTSAQIRDKITELLAEWDFGDESVYPWREDSAKSAGPKVSCDEGQAGPYLPFCAWNNDTRYSGEIMGKPAIAGIDRVWDAGHENYCVCSDPFVFPVNYCFYVRDRGAWSTDCGVARATQWLNTRESNMIPDGAFVGSGFFWTTPCGNNSGGANQQIAGPMWACKYAEIIFPQQSYNYFRPCGPDRFQPSSSGDWCITNTTGLTIDIEPFGPPIDNLNNGDWLWVCGTAENDGLWKVASSTAYQVTLTDPRYLSASFLATPPIPDCGSGKITKIRWSAQAPANNGLEPAICGRIAVTAANNENPVTCSFANDDTWFVNGDQVIIQYAKGLTQINGVHTVEVIGNKQVALLGVNGLSASAYKGGGQAWSPNTPDYRWNDTATKNEFQVKTWDFNYRDTGEYYRITGSAPYIANECQCNSIYNPTPPGCPDPDPCDPCTPCSPPTIPTNPRINQAYCGLDQNVKTFTCKTECLPYNACVPVAAYFSPNTENFSKDTNIVSTKNYGWATDIKLDEQYSAMWQGIFQRSMTDPLANYPSCVCSFDGDFGIYDCSAPYWRQDDGNCNADDEIYRYFAGFNQYEARCEVPVGSPEMPPETYIGCIKQSTLLNSNYPDCPKGGYVCNAPYAYSSFPFEDTCNAYRAYTIEAPWINLIARENCVCADGRFTAEYEANGVFCPNGTVNPP